MTITTKFDIGQTVYFIQAAKINEAKISGIVTTVSINGDVKEQYILTEGRYFLPENVKLENLYASREDLIASL